MSTYVNKLEIFGLLEGLGDAARQGNAEAVQRFRERLILCPTGNDKCLYDAIDEVFSISGRWVRRMIDESLAKAMLRSAVERAIAALSPSVPV